MAAKDVMIVPLVADDWEYLNEGAAHIILSNRGAQLRNKVLRLKKVLNKTLIDDQLQQQRQLLERFIGDNYLELGNLIQLEPKFLEKVAANIQNLRPSHRASFPIDASAHHGVILNDLTKSPSDVFDVHPEWHCEEAHVITIEIKPKCGVLPSSSFVGGCKKETCRYCMHQVLKVEKGEVRSRSNYCPIDLFSMQSDRIRSALRSLLANPQNNMRVFRDGVLTFAGEKTKSTSQSDSSDDEKLEKLKSDLRPTFPGIDEEFENPIENLISTVEMILMREHLLSDLKRMQELDILDIEVISHLYAKLKEGKELPVHLKDHFEGMTPSEMQHAIDEFLLASTAKDCSIMINLRAVNKEKFSQGSHGFSLASPPGCQWAYIYRLSVVDLDLKSENNIPSYRKLDDEIIRTFENSDVTKKCQKMAYQGFATGRGNKLTVNKSALSKVAHHFEEAAEEPKAKPEGFTTGKGRKLNPVSKESMAKAQKLFDEASAEAKPVEAPKHQGFSTGKGKALTVSKESLAKVQHLFDDGNDVQEDVKAPPYSGFSTGKGKKLEFSKESMDKAKLLFEEEDLKALSKAVSEPPPKPAPVKKALAPQPKTRQFKSPVKVVKPPPPIEEPDVSSPDKEKDSIKPGEIAQHMESSLKKRKVNNFAYPSPSSTPSPTTAVTSTPRRSPLGLRPLKSSAKEPSLSTPTGTLPKRLTKGFVSPRQVSTESSPTSLKSTPKRTINYGDCAPVRGGKAKSLVDVAKKSDKKSLRSYGNEFPEVLSWDELISLGFPTEILSISAENSASFEFSEKTLPFGYSLESEFSHIAIKRGATIGFKDFQHALINAGADASLLSENWVENHYRWIVWKLAAMERRFSKNESWQTGERWLTPGTVMSQLKLRYERDINRAQRSILKKILEKDDFPNVHMILCVSALEIEGENVKLELTDGWYCVKARLDANLEKHALLGKIYVGLKLRICGAELVGTGQPVTPLEVTSSTFLKLNSNSTRRAFWFSKLGKQRGTFPQTNLNALLKDGGMIPHITVIVQRQYPILFRETLPDKSSITRDEAEEENAKAKFFDERARNFDRKKSDEEEITERNVSPFLKLKVSDCPPGVPMGNLGTATITLWRPTEFQVESTKEGRRVRILGVLPGKYQREEEPIQLTANSRTIFEELTHTINTRELYQPRLYTPFHHLSQIPKNSEFDSVGIFLTVSEEQETTNSFGKSYTFQNMYMMDPSLTLLCIILRGTNVISPEKYSTGTILALFNLNIRFFDVKVGMMKCYRNDESQIQRTTKQSYLVQHFQDVSAWAKSNASIIEETLEKVQDITEGRYEFSEEEITRHRAIAESIPAQNSEKKQPLSRALEMELFPEEIIYGNVCHFSSCDLNPNGNEFSLFSGCKALGCRHVLRLGKSSPDITFILKVDDSVNERRIRLDRESMKKLFQVANPSENSSENSAEKCLLQIWNDEINVDGDVASALKDLRDARFQRDFDEYTPFECMEYLFANAFVVPDKSEEDLTDGDVTSWTRSIFHNEACQRCRDRDVKEVIFYLQEEWKQVVQRISHQLSTPTIKVVVRRGKFGDQVVELQNAVGSIRKSIELRRSSELSQKP
eukprot:TRINITY_DN6024_c0_g1_i4.p1 TRINITY_DN6024_c0_g1~~TRINITY_DN6024_c0_g1_i4.p1  ORF type:complete len:1593 (+),score=497.31 TRINITY_DN6024_c0_g1_i4:55-4833(+)